MGEWLRVAVGVGLVYFNWVGGGGARISAGRGEISLDVREFLCEGNCCVLRHAVDHPSLLTFPSELIDSWARSLLGGGHSVRRFFGCRVPGSSLSGILR